MKIVGIFFGVCAALLLLSIAILDWSYLKEIPEGEPLPQAILPGLILMFCSGAGAIFFGVGGLLGVLTHRLYLGKQDYIDVCQSMDVGHSLIKNNELVGQEARWKTLPHLIQ